MFQECFKLKLLTVTVKPRHDVTNSNFFKERRQKNEVRHVGNDERSTPGSAHLPTSGGRHKTATVELNPARDGSSTNDARPSPEPSGHQEDDEVPQSSRLLGPVLPKAKKN